jgi:hypothetical protein
MHAGLCLEANPMYWRDLCFRKCQVVGAAMGHNRMERVKFAMQEEYGGIIGDKLDNKKDNAEAKAKSYYTVPLLEILQRNNAPRVIDYLSLDVEGAEYYIMEVFPFDQYIVCVMTIERPGKKLERFGKAARLSICENDIWLWRNAVGSLVVYGFIGFEFFHAPRSVMVNSISIKCYGCINTMSTQHIHRRSSTYYMS